MADLKKKNHYFVGLDVHQKFTALCIRHREKGIVREQTVYGDSRAVCIRLGELMDGLKGTCDVAFEAGDGYGLWHERLSGVARRVVVGHPGHLIGIWKTKKKNDRIDAKKLSLYLMTGDIEPVHVPSPEVRAWRMMINHRRGLVQKRTGVKCQLRAVLRRSHIPGVPRNLWSAKNLRWLAGVELPTDVEALQRDMLLTDLEHFDRQIARVEKELDKRAQAHPAVRQLKTIPQVGNRTAEVMVAWIDQVGRFARTKQVGAYFGFVPTLDASSDRQRLGHITRQGPGVVRQMLVEAVWRMKRRAGCVRKWVESYQHGQKKRTHIAVVAAAHKLARAMYAMLRDGTSWAPVDRQDKPIKADKGKTAEGAAA